MTSAEQLRANATATAARSMRYPVRLSAFAFELLMAFLKGARLFLPLGTINEHVNLQARGLSRLLCHSTHGSIMQRFATSSPCISGEPTSRFCSPSLVRVSLQTWFGSHAFFMNLAFLFAQSH